MGDLGRLTREPRQRKIESHAASELGKWFSGLGHLCKQEGVSLNPQHHVKARHDAHAPASRDGDVWIPAHLSKMRSFRLTGPQALKN